MAFAKWLQDFASSALLCSKTVRKDGHIYPVAKLEYSPVEKGSQAVGINFEGFRAVHDRLGESPFASVVSSPA